MRTLFLLQYISNRELREQITASTNKVEAYNGFAKYFFFGGEGVIADNDPVSRRRPSNTTTWSPMPSSSPTWSNRPES